MTEPVLTANGDKVLNENGIFSLAELLEAVAKHYGKRIFVYFIGTLAPDGSQWCPDCRAADDIVKSALSELPPNGVFLTVQVGDRPTWKDQGNPFRHNKACAVSSIPTLTEFGSDCRLSDEDMKNRTLIVKLFKGE
ncbi:hypothetical protein D915_010385 [Fasciola hepatica]|uniref:Thioredoxin domain-containing protein 17 n=1 Tax=Fasciola hepatica TaxID=6192 RepID=A0A4E0QTZ1_FASHE|nr:hypothetical protein D915_010385 [Fasciola hepatica]